MHFIPRTFTLISFGAEPDVSILVTHLVSKTSINSTDLPSTECVPKPSLHLEYPVTIMKDWMTSEWTRARHEMVSF